MKFCNFKENLTGGKSGKNLELESSIKMALGAVKMVHKKKKIVGQQIHLLAL